MDASAIERVGLKVATLDLADHLLNWDKKQAKETVEVTLAADPRDPTLYRTIPNPDARRCPVDPSHGILQIHASGAQLMCCTTRPTLCDYAEPVSR